jgi:hypothetical protein
LLTDVPQSLLAGTGVLARNEPRAAADLLAARKPPRCPDDQNVSQSRDRSHPRGTLGRSLPRSKQMGLSPYEISDGFRPQLLGKGVRGVLGLRAIWRRSLPWINNDKHRGSAILAGAFCRNESPLAHGLEDSCAE